MKDQFGKDMVSKAKKEKKKSSNIPRYNFKSSEILE